MKKIIRLTETQLTKIIKRVVMESKNDRIPFNELPDELKSFAKENGLKRNNFEKTFKENEFNYKTNDNKIATFKLSSIDLYFEHKNEIPKCIERNNKRTELYQQNYKGGSNWGTSTHDSESELNKMFPNMGFCDKLPPLIKNFK